MAVELASLTFVFLLVGTQRRNKKVVHHQEVNEDKKLKQTIKKFGKWKSINFWMVFVWFNLSEFTIIADTLTATNHLFCRAGMQQLQDIDEVNMFKDDHTVIHFRKPQSKCQHQILSILDCINGSYQI